MKTNKSKRSSPNPKPLNSSIMSIADDSRNADYGRILSFSALFLIFTCTYIYISIYVADI